jgi:hypothetical protein
MDRGRIASRLALAILLSTSLVGCGALSTVWGSDRTDALQKAVFEQQAVYSPSGEWKQDPRAVLNEVPLGTPVERARWVMLGHGFECSDEESEDGGPFLFCKASRATGWWTSEVAMVKLLYREGRIASVDVRTYGDGF